MELGSEGTLRVTGGEPMLKYNLKGAVIRLGKLKQKQRQKNYIFGEPEQNICRVCLSTDSYAFYHLLDCGLQNDFHNITGIQISPDDELPQLICCICRELLRKAAAFRNKSINTQNILSLGQVTINDQNTVTTPLICFTQTETLLISIPSATPTEDVETITIDLEDKSIEKEENGYKSECEDEVIDSETSEKSEANGYLSDGSDDFDMDVEVSSDENNDSDENLVKVKDFNTTKSLKKASPEAKVKTVRSKKFPELNKGDPNIDANILKESLSRTNTNKNKTKYRTNTRDKRVVKSLKAEEELRKKYNLEIKILTLGEQIADVKNRANTENYKTSLYKCDECFRGFQFESTYSCHMKCHDPAISGNVKCEVCNKRFINRRSMMKHQSMHKFQFICKVCGHVCKTKHLAKEHALTHSGEKHKCEYCSKTFCKPANRASHMRIRHGVPQCEICYDLAPSGLAVHHARRHKETFKCKCCDKKFNDAAALAVHSSDSTNGVCSERPCTRCGEGFSTESEWSAHVEDHRRDVKRHEMVKFSLNKSKNPSEATGLPEPPRAEMCEICGATFNTPRLLGYHQRIHTGEKPYACTYCPKRFRLRYLLKMHINTHTGERPYKCEKCPKDFRSPMVLWRHQLVHTKERRHRCTFCEKTFLTSWSVKKHVKSVHFKERVSPRVRNGKKCAE